MDFNNNTMPVVFERRHFVFAAFVWLLWSLLILTKDHSLGCPASHGIFYNTFLHLLTLSFYMFSHAMVLHQIERLNRPFEFAISKMGRILVILRQIKFYLIIRVFIISFWLFLVFYVNAEETSLPVFVLLIHLLLVVFTINKIVSAVTIDNSKLINQKEKMKLNRLFKIACFVEVFCSVIWLIFNMIDVHFCHSHYAAIL